MDYSNNPVYGYNLKQSTMNSYAEIVKDCILNNKSLPKVSGELKRFVTDFYNVIKDFNHQTTIIHI